MYTLSDVEPPPAGDLVDLGVERDLQQSGMYLSDQTDTRPNNWDELMAVVADENPVVYAADQERFEGLRRLHNNARNHSDMIDRVLPIFHMGYRTENRIGVTFTNMAPLFSNVALEHARPDFYDGSDSQDLDMRIQNQMRHYLLPTTDGQHNPVAPNVFMDIQDSDYPPAAARRLALYNGSAGARAMLVLQSVEQDVPFDGNAYTVTATYVDGLLRLYAVHATPTDARGRLADFHMTELGAWYLWGSLADFRGGVSAFRNLREWARRTREELVRQANDRLPPPQSHTLRVRMPEMLQHQYVPIAADQTAIPVNTSASGHVLLGDESLRYSPSEDLENRPVEPRVQPTSWIPRKRARSASESHPGTSASELDAGALDDDDDHGGRRRRPRKRRRIRSPAMSPQPPFLSLRKRKRFPWPSLYQRRAAGRSSTPDQPPRKRRRFRSR